MPRLRVLLLSLVAVACSSSASSPPPSELALWTDAPAAPVDVYEGRTTEVPVTIRARDPLAVMLEPAADGGLTIEVVAPDTPAPDGLFHARLLLRAGYGLTEPTARVTLIEGAARSTIELPLRPHTLSWKPSSWSKGAGPQTREHGVFVLDPVARAAFLLQGSGYSPQWEPIADSWRLDLATQAWTPWTPTGDVPPATAGMRTAAVPNSNIAYVHGGYTGFKDTEVTRGELYRVDLGNAARQFTRLASTPEAGAAPRNLHAIAYDAKGEQLVVFGGVTSTPFQAMFDDTWLVKVAGDAATWTKLETARKPSARYGAFYAFDEPSRRFVVWSGGQKPKNADDQVNAANDAWALDLTVVPPAWSKLAPAGEAPPGRRNGCVMHDPIGRRLFVFGGTSDAATTRDGLYVLDLEPGREAWTKLELPNTPAARSSGFGFATPEGGVACGFGNGDAVYSDVNVLGYFDDAP